jgi:hypothetical protein
MTTIKFSRKAPTPLRPSLTLRQITAEDLEWAASSGLYTWGTLEEFKSVLPRMLECVANSGSVAGTRATSLFAHFTYGDWRHWNKREQQALSDFISAWWSRILAEYPCSLTPAEEALCAIANANVDLKPLLNLWEKDFEPASTRHLAAFIIACQKSISSNNKLPDAFWGFKGSSGEEVITWLNRPALPRHMEILFSKAKSPDCLRLFSDAHESLNFLQRHSG